MMMVMVKMVVMLMTMTIDPSDDDNIDDDSKPPPFSQIIWVGWLNGRGKEVGAFLPIWIFYVFCSFATLFNIWPLNILHLTYLLLA